ncbi:glycosyltransferase [Marinoscillum pacificum]|uniref:glycosyltransferase n=1 Tax=Marinoscillum pacificum TaxID=392723 RepID=UPI002156FA75|nr:glycosyltransferase family 2 protein [Marinoscillum pacificum]
MYYKLSIIFGFKNRDTVRVRRCLDSLQQQSLKEFHVCFVDYGSEDNVSGEIQALVQRYSFCKYVHVPSQGQFWNRGHALNIGVRQSKPSEYILTTDIDLVFPPNFIENLIGYLRPDREVHFSARDLSQGFDRWGDLHHGKLYGESRPNTALGLAQAVLREKFEAINGFDEFYCIWGVEDEDLSERLTQIGVETKWVYRDDCVLYHQWHPTSGRRNFNLPSRWQEFLVKYKEGNKSSIRNSEDWGTFKSERAVLSKLETQSDGFVLDDIPLHLITLFIKQKVDEMSDGDVVKLTFKDSLYLSVENSRLMRFIKKINKFLDRKNSGLMLTNDLNYYKKHHTVYDYRDAVAYFILYNRRSLRDYFLEVKQDSLLFVISK